MPSKPTLISERTVPDQLSPPVESHSVVSQELKQAMSLPPPTKEPASPPSNRAFLDQFLATMAAIAMVLSTRLLLLMTMLGSFTLSYLAISTPGHMTLMAAASFDVLVLIPIVALYWQRG